MNMRDNQKRLNVYIPEDLYTRVAQSGRTVTEVVIQALESFLDRNSAGQQHAENTEFREVQEARIKELHEQIKVTDEHQQNRINDLKTQIQSLNEQMHTKDDQISQLNEVTQKQAVHIQSLIQENSKLNTKLLPENIENNKPWWKFW
jgi:chromosome segregation ATPase